MLISAEDVKPRTGSTKVLRSCCAISSSEMVITHAALVLFYTSNIAAHH